MPTFEGPWRKSTYSNNAGSCVEVDDGLAGVVAVRDSKDPAGPVLVIRERAWGSFVDAVLRGDLDR